MLRLLASSGRCLRLVLLSVIAGLAIFVLSAAPTHSNETITNTATAGGGNLPTNVTSNPTTLVAAPARLELTKTADRAAAEPGDTIVYRLILENTGGSTARDIRLTDNLPLGVRYLPASLQGSLVQAGSPATVALPPAQVSDRQVTFTFPELPADATLNLVYAVTVTPDAIRGDGRNRAQEPRSNLATYEVLIRPGILSDCGTIIGRVFVDKNFDGEQQPGEPGVPNAVVFLDNGNRVVADAQGLFSLANVLSGDRVGTLDLSSIPGYDLAPNLYRLEGNSQARLVRLQPGGLVRMNFGVTPAAAAVS
ncbi:MAG: DUF11 domain-containing protein [Spirulinaceae cyanobacterium SM2_1_0]|nr:DUF11 domain-containing protein [Spirulinaceae cyanobacterium SM2_1_0]